MDETACQRREFLRQLLLSCFSLGGILAGKGTAGPAVSRSAEEYDPRSHSWGMGIAIDKCIGCGRCADACKKENDVPTGPFFFRTWVEPFVLPGGGEVGVRHHNGGP